MFYIKEKKEWNLDEKREKEFKVLTKREGCVFRFYGGDLSVFFIRGFGFLVFVDDVFSNIRYEDVFDCL